jgi:hypothetical protein
MKCKRTPKTLQKCSITLFWSEVIDKLSVEDFIIELMPNSADI